MPREDVDRAALAANRERHLCFDFPAERCQQIHDPAGYRCVALVEQPIYLAATPADGDHDVGVERGAVATKLGHVAHAAALTARHIILGQTGCAGDIDLPPTQAVAQRSQDPPDSLIVHDPRSMPTPAWQRLTTELSGTCSISLGRRAKTVALTPAPLDTMRETRRLMTNAKPPVLLRSGGPA